MSRRSLYTLVAFLLAIAGVSATVLALGPGHGAGTRISGEPAADAAGADHTVTLQNNTSSRIWIGSVVNADGSSQLGNLPALDPGQSATLTIPEHEGAGHWRGRFFAREGCTGQSGSTFHCAVGDCGPYADHCSTGEQPDSLAEFNFDPGDGGAPWYDVSYVDAASMPVTITPDDAAPPQSGQCGAAGCAVDLLSSCPAQNLVRDQGTGQPLVCVNPNRDAQTAYSDAITKQCPKAYAWSKQDAVPGNQVMADCTECKGLTVSFGTGSPSSPQPAPTGADSPSPSPTPSPAAPPSPSSSPAASGSSPQRGVALNDDPNASQDLADSKASWYYNWTSSAGSVATPPGVDYVPMIWGPGSVTDAELGAAAKSGKELLGFQEPDSPTQANMTPEQALDLWPRLQQTGLRLGAPAVASGADQPGGWLDRFMTGAAQRGLRVDFIPLHWFGGDFGPNAANELRDYLQAVYNRYHKPIWLTQYALIDYSHGTPRYPTPQQQADFIKSSTQMLDGLGFVERYAWFALTTQTSPTGLYDGTTANSSGLAYDGR
ncbi:glycosyl hydrolase [Phaeacidiphilus oryzae]|uniref:glycosyl hydrolase n=1 Tax=Phaeacidiphilus oryzae TaxID=348818 RepID=UPI00126A777D|nr:glycosyl hydrolase [Phaeacidiphilus oryzae]